MIFLSLNPILSANFRNSCESNGIPLSLFSSLGIPKIENVFENKHCVKPSQLKVGDSVLVKQEKKDKLTTPFNPTPNFAW
jgi:hypothetical protein